MKHKKKRELLTELSQIAEMMEANINELMVIEPAQARVIVRWIIGSHMMHHYREFPRIIVTATTKRAGKSRLLEIVEAMTYKSSKQSNPTAACIALKPEDAVLVLDEADKAKYGKDMLTILNDGYNCTGVWERVGFDSDGDKIIESTNVYKAVAIGGIGLGWLDDTLLDRSIVIHLKRATRATVEDMAVDMKGEWRPTVKRVKTICEKLKTSDIRVTKTSDIKSSNGRLISLWQPLFDAGLLISLGDMNTDDFNTLNGRNTKPISFNESVLQATAQALNDKHIKINTCIHKASGEKLVTSTQILKALKNEAAFDGMFSELNERKLGTALNNFNLRNKQERIRPQVLNDGDGLTIKLNARKVSKIIKIAKQLKLIK